ncbi:MAG: DUF1934 domain-containing protein [Ruminococcus sp.]|nr:DUF1934 domain-containing protein [Ruminococcus sp.]
MKEKWIMTLHNVQCEDEEKTEVTLNTEISYEKDSNGGRIITYRESEATGMNGSVTQVQISPDNMITIIRAGKFNMHLVVQMGRKHFCNYETPYGNTVFGISAKFIDNTLTDEGGILKFRYMIDTNSSLVSDNEISIEIKKHVC